MGSGFGRVYPAPPSPLHAHCIVEVAGLCRTTMGLSRGTDGGPFWKEAQKKKKQAKVGGPWGGSSQPGLLPGTWENIRSGGGSKPSEKEVLDLF